jgi:hypothetical protein
MPKTNEDILDRFYPSVIIIKNNDKKYLDEVTDFIKLNYKCPKGTVDDSNKCNPEEQEKSNTSDSKSASETFIGFKADHDFSNVDPTIMEVSRPDILKVVHPELQQKLNSLSDDLNAKTTSRDKLVLGRYTNNGYNDINEYLSGKLEKDLDPEHSIIKHAKEDTKDLDMIFKSADLSTSMVTFRGISDDTAKSNPGLSEALDTPGSELNFKCFTSTSVLPFVAVNFAHGYEARVLEIQLPKGSKALYIADVSKSPSEFEVLINRDTKYEVIGTKTTKIINPYKKNNERTMKVTTLRAII